MVRYLSLKLSVNEDGLLATTGLTIKHLLRNGHVILHELPLYRRKENNCYTV